MAAAKPAPQLKLAGNLQTRAAFEPASFDAEKGTAELVFTTGARGLRQPWLGDAYYEELEVSERAVDLGRLNNGASLLAAHDGYSLSGVIGVVERAWISGKEGRALVRFSDREDVKPIRNDVAAGILRHVSVGYSVQKYEKREEEGNKIPILRATRWTPAEISLVPIAFDDAATVRSATQFQPQPYEVEVVTTPQEQERLMADPKQTSIPAVVQTPAPDVAPIASPAAETADAIRSAELAGANAERTRIADIRQAVRAGKLDDAFADEHIAARSSADQVRALVLTRLYEEGEKIKTEQHVRIDAGEDAADKFQRGAMAWLFAKSMTVDVIRKAQKLRPDDEMFREIALDPGEFRGMSLVDLARASLERHGVSTRGMDKMRLVAQALVHRGVYQTTSDFAVLLENVTNKTLLASYATTPDTWRRFCAVRSAADFRAQNYYRNGSFSTLDALNEHGEFKNKVIPDGEKGTYSVGTKGNIIGITRQAIVNDDMGAFNDLATRFGRAAALSIESDVYALILLNSGLGPTIAAASPFFDYTLRKNVNGTGSALTVDGIDADRMIMAAQVDPSNLEFLDLRPEILLVPIGLGGTARVINESQYDPDTANKLQRPNKVRGTFRDIIDTPRLTGTRRYLFASPDIAPAFLVAFLEGQQNPVLESKDGWRVDGIEWKVRIDYGVKEADFRGAVTNAGT